MSGVPNPREADPRDRREPTDVVIPPPERLHDPLDDVLTPRAAYVPNPHEPDPRDTRDTRAGHGINADPFFTFPSRARLGQYVTSTFGRLYQWDGDQWIDTGGVVAVPPTTYTFRIGIDETSPGIVDVIPAKPTEIGGLLEPATDGQYARTALAGVYSWTPVVSGGAFVGDDPPPLPTQGMLWFESDTGKLWMFYVDATSSQWVMCGGPG